MYLFHLCASGISAAVTVAPIIDQPILCTCLMLTLVYHPHIHPSPPPSQHLLFPGPGCSPEQGVYSSYHNEKWMERLAALCHRASVACSPSQHAKGLVVVTDKMAAASDDCNYAAYIYQENDLSRSLSPSAASMCHMATAIHWKFLKMTCASILDDGNLLFALFVCVTVFFLTLEASLAPLAGLSGVNVVLYQISCGIMRLLWRGRGSTHTHWRGIIATAGTW